MPRAKGGPKTRQRRKKRLKQAKGYYGGKSRLFRTATEAVDKSNLYAYRDRRQRKRDFRRLWIARINAAAGLNGLSYSRFMAGLKAVGVGLNRKTLADMAVNDADGFTKLAQMVVGKQAAYAA
jgi:large subunit ribosomal protein L20